MKEFETRAEEEAYIGGKTKLYDRLRGLALKGSVAAFGSDAIVFAVTRSPLATGIIAGVGLAGLGLHAAANSMHEGYIQHEYQTDPGQVAVRSAQQPPATT